MLPRMSVVGGGRMGTALVRGLVASGWRSADVAVAELSAPRRAELVDALPGATISADVVAAEGIVVAVKPDAAEEACRAVARVNVDGARPVLSIMAGVSLGRLESWLAPRTPVVRAMPNTPAMVGAGVAAIAPGSTAAEETMAWAEEVLGSVGTVVRVGESELDAVTGLSGSGPAYVFLMVEALAEAGVAVGLPADLSRTLASGTLAGAARLLIESGEDPEALRAQVTSPGGTTEAGLRVLEERGLRVAVTAAVAAATARSRQLGGPRVAPRRSADGQHAQAEQQVSWAAPFSHSPQWRTVASGGRGVIPLSADDVTSARYLTVREVASALRVSNMTVYRLINAGELPAVRVGKSFRLREDDVNRYLADRYTQAG